MTIRSDRTAKLLSMALAVLLLSNKAAAKETADFSKLYKARQYDTLCKIFEQNERSYRLDPNSSYFYALALLNLGKQTEALQMCKAIEQKFPNSEAAKLSRTTLKAWSTTARNYQKSAQTERSRPQSNNRTINAQTGIIGIKFSLGFGLPPIVMKVFKNTPAYLANIQIKDQIVSVNGVPTEGLSEEEIFTQIIGPPNSPVTLTIIRDNKPEQKSMRRMAVQELLRIDPDTYQEYLMSL